MINPHVPPAVRYITDRDLMARFAVSRPTIWRWLAEGVLPRPVHLTPGTTRWRLSDIEAFEAQRLAASAAPAQERDASAGTS